MWGGFINARELARARERVIADLLGKQPARTFIGAYELLHVIGRGGFGTVWRARDTRLDRTVALKQVHVDDDGERAPSIADEARALAQVQHPNVAQVYDIFRYRGGTYAAFEFVPGSTLKSWLARVPRSAAEIDEVMRAAAHGLSAVHAAGWAHGDFKPTNVIVTDERDVKLLDFGLSRPQGHDQQTAGGTPAYMAPELLAGGPATPRSDQYSLAITWRDALRLASDRRQHGRSASSATPRTSSRDRALLRACLDDPSRRWPDVDALLEAARPRAHGHPWLWIGGGVAACVAMLLIGSSHPVAIETKTCDIPTLPWNEVDHRTLREKFVALDPSVGGITHDAILEQLDVWTDRWQTTYAEVCGAAPRVRRPRLECLERQRHQAAALSQALERPDHETLHVARAMVSSLPSARSCLESPSLSPTRPEFLGKLHARIYRAHMALRRDEASRALGELHEVRLEARDAGLLDLEALVTLETAVASHRQGATVRAAALAEDAYLLGMKLDDRAFAARAAAQTAVFHAGNLDPHQTLRWIKTARSLQDERSPRYLVALVQTAVAIIESDFGQAERAEAALLEGLEAMEGHLETAPHVVVSMLGNLAHVRVRRGNCAGAIEPASRAIEIHVEKLGENTPSFPGTATSLASIWTHCDDPVQARDLMHRALGALDRSTEQNTPLRMLTHLNLALLELDDDPRSSVEHAHAGLATLEAMKNASFMGNGVEFAKLLTRAHFRLGDLPKAESSAIHAVELAIEHFGAVNLATTDALRLLGWVRTEMGACKLAQQALDQAVIAGASIAEPEQLEIIEAERDGYLAACHERHAPS